MEGVTESHREMYMNCAPITVAKSLLEQSSKNSENISFYPPVFVANIDGCMTKEGVDIRFPESGDTIEVRGQGEGISKVVDQYALGTLALDFPLIQKWPHY